MHVYVYYRLAGDPARAWAAVGALFARIESESGVCGRLLARCDDPHTWMEVYEPVADRERFCTILAALAADCGVTQHARDGIRHVECFAAVPTSGPAG